jgi:small subunit ribosomal protein S1
VTSKTKSEPTTMAELLAGSTAKIKGYTLGDKVRATVLAKTPKALILDIGGKSEGMVAEKAFQEAKEFIRTLEIGDEVTAMVLVPETREGNVLLSLRQASADAAWSVLETAMKDGSPLVVLGKGANSSGVAVEVEGVQGFVPSSQLGKETAKNAESLVGKYFKAIVIDLDKSANKVVLSEKEISEAADIKAQRTALAKIKEGQMYDGVVTTVANFGCFVKLDLGKEKALVEGLVHISELSWEKTARVSDVVKVGDKVKVRVIGARDGRLSLSIKHGEADPWDNFVKKFKVEDKFKGKVMKLSDFGIFVQIIPGVEGLVHMTKIPPATKFTVGQEVNCYIEELNVASKKVGLGLVLTSKPVGYK